MELTDGIVTLRPPRPDDAGWVTDSCRDPETQQWLPGLPSPYGPADAEAWLDLCAHAWATGDAAPFVITAAADGERLGVIELRFGSPADVGYWAAPAGRGRGAVTRALVLLVAYGFGRGLERIELFTLPDNVRSQAVALRAGFVRDGSVPGKIPSRDGVSYDAFRFTLTPGAPRAAAAAAGA
jgi:RimJ/RimL family protein N-acetyltransferase